jgi:ParB-like chromosome segregation protein Spo0J
MRNGAVFPPIVLFWIKHPVHGYRIYDGRHRARASRHVGFEAIPAYVTRWNDICDDMTFWDSAGAGMI